MLMGLLINMFDVVSESSRGWTKESNLIFLGMVKNQNYDICDWVPEHEKP